MAHGFSCPAACGIFPDQGSNSCLLHWQADSLPLSHQGSPPPQFIFFKPCVLNLTPVPCQRRQWQPTPALLPGKSHGRKSLVGCGPWGREESDTTEHLHFHFHFHALEKEMATHSSVLTWRIPGMAEPGGLPSLGSHRVGHN